MENIAKLRILKEKERQKTTLIIILVIITVMRYINNNSNGVINNYSQKICSCFANHIIKSLYVESKKNRIFYHTKSFIIEIKVVRFKDTHNA